MAEQLGVEPAVTARVGTLSKALGCSGGFICGSRLLIEWLIQRARSTLLDGSPGRDFRRRVAALEIVIAEPQRRGELLQQAAALRARLAASAGS